MGLAGLSLVWHAATPVLGTGALNLLGLALLALCPLLVAARGVVDEQRFANTAMNTAMKGLIHCHLPVTSQ